MSKGMLLVISGPSGVGKSTAISGLSVLHPEMEFSVSATTRAMRQGDVEGVTYYFKTREEFQSMVDNDEFYEYAIYASNCYGTPRAEIDARLENGIDVILDIEPQGALQVKERCKDAVLVFLAAPSFEVLEQRLRGRGDTKEEDIEKRLAQARWEYTQASKYDYIVLSDVPERTVKNIDSILNAEKLRAERMHEFIKMEESL